MVPLEQAIRELNTGKITFHFADTACATEGEIVIYLERLAEFEAIGLEP